jgi:soluble epoxide hydrolase/lipid-phosphate phosphatase
VLRVFYTKGNPSGYGKPSPTATTIRDGGWRGGGEMPDPSWRQIPDAAMCIDQDLYEDLVTAMETTSWWGADAWYMNHARNKVWNSTQSVSRLITPHLLIMNTSAGIF